MIADALRIEIDRYASRMRRSNPLFTKAADGTFTPACLTRYLTNVRHLVMQTPVLLSRAAARARARGQEELAAHFEHKRAEEQGHDAWADRDLERVTRASGPAALADCRDIAPSITSLVAYLARTIDADPASYLAYVFFAEYLTVMLGPEWLRLLEDNCGVPRSSVSVVGNHVELDREHVEEALDCIDALVGEPSKLPQLRAVLLESIDLFDRFCHEVTAVGVADAWNARDAARHVSAA